MVTRNWSTDLAAIPNVHGFRVTVQLSNYDRTILDTEVVKVDEEGGTYRLRDVRIRDVRQWMPR